ncbi:unnamed protein product [Ectocarpus sp. 6 AP-2014]
MAKHKDPVVHTSNIHAQGAVHNTKIHNLQSAQGLYSSAQGLYSSAQGLYSSAQHKDPAATAARSTCKVQQHLHLQQQSKLYGIRPHTFTTASSPPVKTYCPVRSNSMQKTGCTPWPLVVMSGRIRSLTNSEGFKHEREERRPRLDPAGDDRRSFITPSINGSVLRAVIRNVVVGI